DLVTGVQTCALPIWRCSTRLFELPDQHVHVSASPSQRKRIFIGALSHLPRKKRALSARATPRGERVALTPRCRRAHAAMADNERSRYSGRVSQAGIALASLVGETPYDQRPPASHRHVSLR